MKPENIFLVTTNSERIVKIFDFGIAKVLTPESTNSNEVTKVGEFVGSCHYASPEQCQDSSRVNYASDIYSLGMILYEMLVATNPFHIPPNDLDEEWSYYNSHLNKEPEPLTNQPGGDKIPPALAEIVMKCLRKNPRERFSSINDLEQALQQCSER